MGAAVSDDRLSRITTLWTVVRQAHEGPDGGAVEARGRLVRRYLGAARRYLLGALRDPDAADELAQEFALRFVRGDFHRADPGRGRFRDLVKTVLFHLIVDHQRRCRRNRAHGVPDLQAVPVPGPDASTSAALRFVESWRAELLSHTWYELAQFERKTGSPSYTVLRFRADHPALRSAEMAAALSERLGRPLKAEAVRQALHRARERFADLLLDELAQTLEQPTRDELERELIDLDLLRYCRPALDRRAGSASSRP